MNEIIEFLNANPTGYLATSENNIPHLRPWQFMFEDSGKLWFCTGNNKKVCKQIKHNPNIEFSSMSNSMKTIRVSGIAQFLNDSSIKERILEQNNLVKSIYKNPDNPVFEVFFIEHGKAILQDLGISPAVTVNF